MGTNIANKFNDKLTELKTIITKNGKDREAIIEASETYFNTRKTAKKTIEDNKEKMNKIVDVLLNKETIEKKEFEELMK